MTSQPKFAVNTIFGAMTIGNREEQSRIIDLNDAKAIPDIFRSHGHNEVDTSM